MSQTQGGYHIISNVLDVRATLPIDITPTLRISKADDAQVAQIQSLLTQSSGGGLNTRIYYENDWVETRESDTSSRWAAHPLNREDWRYYIVAFTGSGDEPYPFLRAVNLTCPALSSFAVVHTHGEFGTGKVSGQGVDQVVGALTHLNRHSHLPELLDGAAAAELARAYERYRALDLSKHSGVARAIELLDGLKRVLHDSDLRILGLFAVMEMLLTHKPNDKEVGDSLLHQISTKIPLLSARFSTPLDYSVFDSGVTEEKIWKALYDYRSTIAHGGIPDFKKKPLSSLRSREVAIDFLEDATRRLVRHALNEPELIDALKPI